MEGCKVDQDYSWSKMGELKFYWKNIFLKILKYEIIFIILIGNECCLFKVYLYHVKSLISSLLVIKYEMDSCQDDSVYIYMYMLLAHEYSRETMFQ